MKIKFLTILIISIFGLVLGFRAFAVSPGSILVSVSPKNPAPYENTTITLSSFAANLDTVTITWLVGGKVSLSGIGKKSFAITAGASGTEARVEARIMLPDGEIDKNIVVRPGVLTLLWQANDSYVPPFYKGKALPTSDSDIKVVAMPEIKTGSMVVNPKNLAYAWKKDYTNMQDGSGYGKNFFVFSNDYLDDLNNIGVVASTVDQQYFSEGNIDIVTYSPVISFYKKDPELGTIWEQALGNAHRIVGDEVVVAAPYFISPKDIRRPDLVWSWFINDAMVSVSYPKNVIPLKVQAGVSGVSKLRLNIENSYKIFETASKEINVEF